MSLDVQVAIWHMQKYQAGADRLNHSEAEKTCVSSYRICLSVTLQGPDHKVSCHSKFNNQFSQSELHGGLEEEPTMMWWVLVTFKINIIQY